MKVKEKKSLNDRKHEETRKSGEKREEEVHVKEQENSMTFLEKKAREKKNSKDDSTVYVEEVN